MELTANRALQSCQNMASLVVVVGVGDGEVVRQLRADPMTGAKDIFAIALPGDAEVDGATRVGSWIELQEWVFRHFSDHKDLIRLSGADILDTHPIGAEAEAFRRAHLERLHQCLGDRCWGLGNDINDTFMGFHHACMNAEAILPSPSIGQIAGAWGNIPVISIGAGPSVRDHLNELRHLQNRCLLVACDAVYPALLEQHIIPHVVTPMERLKQQSPLVKDAGNTHTYFMGLPVCHPDTVKPFGHRTVYLHAFDQLYDWLEPNERLRCLTGSSTGVLSFYVAASLTRGPVYLVGHDLAKDVNGKTHWDACTLGTEGFDGEAQNVGEFGDNGYEKRMIPGNDGGLVESITWWDTFRAEIGLQAAAIPDRVFNVNAYDKRYAVIENTRPAPLPSHIGMPYIPPVVLPRVNTERIERYRANRKQLPDDCDRFCDAMMNLQGDIRRTIMTPPTSWDLAALMSRMAPDAGVSAGNSAAFRYILRSAVFNDQSYAGYRARGFADQPNAVFTTMQSIDALCDACINTAQQLKPVMAALC